MTWSDAKRHPPSVSADTPDDDRTWRVIVGDDQPFDRAEAKAALLRGSTRRYDFVECSTAAQVLDAITDPEAPVDCVILDYRLPDADAPDVLSRIPRTSSASDLPAVPVVVVTGGDGGATGAQWNRAVLRAGAQDFIGKDWLTPASLTRAVEGAVERHAMTRGLGERERALRNSQARLQLTLEGGEMGTWEWDLDTDIVRHDGRIAELWGLGTVKKRSVQDMFDVVHPDDLPDLQADIEKARTGSGRFESEFRVILPDGHVRWLAGRGALARDDDGDTLSLYGLNYDLTERREQEAALQQKNSEMERFAYTVSHDLKSPLVTISGFLGLLKGHVQAGRSEKALAAADRVLGATERMSMLIQDLLTLSRAGRSSGNPEPVDLDALANRLAAEFEPRAREAGGAVAVSSPVGTILAGPQGVSEALENLLANAVRYGLGGGGAEIRVRSEPTASGGLRLIVEDDGPGIPHEYRDRVFELFQRLSTDREGTGVGLAVVARVMEVLGGSAGVEDADGPPDQPGARFVLTFPPEAVLPLRHSSRGASSLGSSEAPEATP